MAEPYSVFVRDLQARTLCISVTCSTSLEDLKTSIQEATGIPHEEQCINGRHILDEDATLAEQGLTADSNLQLTGRLRGGKGGFGSLLRGSGKTAMTENEDACRDLSGRRLRLVNADKKLKDWAAAEKQRKDEKQAAKEEREKAKAEIRAEDAQVNLEAIRKDQSAVIASVAKALESSRKAGAKRSVDDAKLSKPATKKTRYSSESEDELDSDVDSDSDNGINGKEAQDSAPELTKVIIQKSAASQAASSGTSAAAGVPIAT